VTTCIAAITVDNCIVTSSDTRMSFGGDFSVEGVIKVEPVHGEWSAMIGGNDVAQCVPVLERAKQVLKGKSDDFLVVMRGFKRAYQQHRQEVITDEFLSPYGMTLEEFKKKGRKLLDPAVHADLLIKIRLFNLGCAFLIYGYDEKKSPHLFELRNPGKTTIHDKPGFWAIGTGASAALSMLANLGQEREGTRLPDTIYNVLAAKYSSESASDVGPDTFFFVQQYGSYAMSTKGGFEKSIRNLWEQEGRPRIPPSIGQIVEGAEMHFWQKSARGDTKQAKRSMLETLKRES
jgi:hypothetical protein